ncbi:transketolase [Maridesulfovibrio hydrothermalis]|uniref:Putative transketolase N-terminal section n=1 Tax=Maridesulfovibrio hydrothermalis AM13 = DSM 14728 TaxID=1121451 RepID=L0R9L2_9BACT|nr:transketolase [Maridesulfovibrio hydrothermalis]CCO23453.1 putative transketolase N-terminal section [Maridesulfovibrio hydrothermalis AM13 = DSM 14728]
MDQRSKLLRKRIAEVLHHAGRGHIGPSMSLVEILRVLYDSVLKYNPQCPDQGDRDRFILSKGHGCLALYVMLEDKGFITEKELFSFCCFEGLLGGHPAAKIPGVEFATGSLGHGLSFAVGVASALRINGSDSRVFTVLGDGECGEGSVWEAAMSAGKQKLSSLTAIVDYNKLQSYGCTEMISGLEPFADKWKSFGFAVKEVDGHNVKELEEAFFSLPFDQSKPSVVICHTVKGKGIPFAEGNPSWHHKTRMSAEEYESMIKCIEDYDA